MGTSPPQPLAVDVLNEQEDLSCDDERIPPLVRSVVALEGQFASEVAIHLVSEEAITRLHAEHFDDPTPTDCISFPMDGPEETYYRVLGDVFVCPSVAIRYVQEHGGDPFQETTLYIVHGILHLLGYDDIKEEDQKLMRLAEQRAMAHLSKEELFLTPR